MNTPTAPNNWPLFKQGFYETTYGNAAFVASRMATTAYDVDAGEQIPIELINKSVFLRAAKSRRD